MTAVVLAALVVLVLVLVWLLLCTVRWLASQVQDESQRAAPSVPPAPAPKDLVWTALDDKQFARYAQEGSA